MEVHGDRLRCMALRATLDASLLNRLREHKKDLLVLLRQPRPVSPTYTDHERRLLARAPEGLKAAVDQVKQAFSDLCPVTVTDVHPEHMG